MTREETLQRARQAAEILDHPLVVEALAKMRADTIARWCEHGADTIAAMMLHRRYSAIGEFEEHFRALINDGKFVEGRQRQDDAAR